MTKSNPLLLILIFFSNILKLSSPCPCSVCSEERTLCSSQGKTEIPFGIPKEVEVLLIATNKINKIRYYDFSSMKNLKELYLEQNQITELEDKAFINNQNLEKLHLESNKLTVIKRGTFDHLTKLTSLYLDNNDLSTVPDDIVFLGKLSDLTISSNNIKTIPWYTFFNLNNLAKLNFFDNPLDCNCNNYELYHWQQDTKKGQETSLMNSRVFHKMCGNSLADLLLDDNGLECTKPSIDVIQQERKERDIVDTSNKLLYKIDSDAYLSCQAGGDPPPLLTWYVPKVVEQEGTDQKILAEAAYSMYTFKSDENERYKVYPNGTLRVKV